MARDLSATQFKELVMLIIQFFNEEKFEDAVHSLERESGVFFNMKYLEDSVMKGDWDNVEKYLLGFTKFDDNRHSIKIFFIIRKQKYLEALDKNDYSRAHVILREDLKVFSTSDEDLYKQLKDLLFLGNFRENKMLSGYGDEKTSRKRLVVDLKKLIEVNPMFENKLQFPATDDSRLRILVNRSLERQHQVCESPKPDQAVKSFLVDHTSGSMPRVGGFLPLASYDAQKKKDPNYQPHPTRDFLNDCLGVDDHPGYVKSVGGDVTIRDYYDMKSRKDQTEQRFKDVQADLLNLRGQFGEMDQIIASQVASQMASYSQQPHHYTRKQRHYVDPSADDTQPDECEYFEELSICERLDAKIVQYDKNQFPPMSWTHPRLPSTDQTLSNEELRTLTKSYEMLNICWLSIFFSYLYDNCVHQGLEHIYGFIDPCYLGLLVYLGDSKQRDARRLVDAKRDCLAIMQLQPNRKCYFLPMLLRAHFQLFVLCPNEGLIVFFCSLCRQLDHVQIFFMQELLQAYMGDGNVRWIIVNSYRQHNSWECGYYCMYWMNEIVTRRIVNDWKSKFAKTNRALEMEEIDHIRDECALYFANVTLGEREY